nr:ParB/RepB/Spo0J family partition protein [Deinococcus aestuarii]
MDALLGQTAELVKIPPTEQTLAVSALRPGPGQPRRVFGEEGLRELAESLREHGVLQPLLVRPAEGGHEIVAGERRWRAAQLAGLTEVPVVIRALSEDQARVVALIENLQREDLNLIDEVDAKLDLAALALGLPREETRARLMRLLREEPGPEAQTLAALFAPLRETWTSFAKNKLRVLNWPPPLLEAVRGGLPFTLAGVIVRAPEEHHDRLITLARGGATRTALRAEIERLGRRDSVGETSPATQVARRLASRRFMSSLDPEAKKAVDRWLARMPEALRSALSERD